MERRIAPLRTLAPTVDNGEASVSSSSRDVKKRRTAISIACDSCRRRKIRCDGRRPVCSNCVGHTSQCEYRDEGAPSKESRTLVTEVIRILSSLPTAEAIRVLDILRHEVSATTILSTLRAAAASDRPLDMPLAVTIREGTADFEQLSSQNPVAYPGLPDPDPSLFQREPYRGLTQSGAREKPPAQEESSRSEPADESQPSQWVPLPRESSQPPEGPRDLCDSRLHDLDIRRWTDVEIDNDLAAKCISLYLETDHPLLGHFDPDLFVSHLVSYQTEYCSSLLVNALLYWACMYSAFDPQTDELATRFCEQAEELWREERARGSDSFLNTAAAEFLSLGYLGQGRDHSVLKYLNEASSMAVRLGLFGGKPEHQQEHQQKHRTRSKHGKEKQPSGETSDAEAARLYAAWGTFNWVTLMSLFYRQPGLYCAKSIPSVPIPIVASMAERDVSLTLETQTVPSAPAYMGITFSFLCQFWSIMHEVTLAYYARDPLPWGPNSLLTFAEFKFRELLAWSNGLPSDMVQAHGNPHHVQIMHLWLHAAILDIFRPCIQEASQGNSRLRTFVGNINTPDSVCGASVAQLKRLIINYRLNYSSSSYSILWHTALIYVANALLESTRDEDWYSYLMVCVYGYEELHRSWRVSEAIMKSLLSMTLRHGDISSKAARVILRDLESSNRNRSTGEVRATFMADLKLALSDPKSATVEQLADDFEENATMEEYTTIFDVDDQPMDES